MPFRKTNAKRTISPEKTEADGKGGNCPSKYPDCPTKHDGMQNSHIQKSAIGLELEFSMYFLF